MSTKKRVEGEETSASQGLDATSDGNSELDHETGVTLDFLFGRRFFHILATVFVEICGSLRFFLISSEDLSAT